MCLAAGIPVPRLLTVAREHAEIQQLLVDIRDETSFVLKPAHGAMGNGILVVRTVAQCASVLTRVFANDLTLKLHKDDSNYRLIESATGSTMRVILT